MKAMIPNVTFEDVLSAANRIEGVAHKTPVVSSRTLDERAGAKAFLKCENFQRMGAFKFRGAYNRLVQLDGGQRKRGVVAFSSGNHAQGVALAANLLGIPATIVMPKDAPKAKLDATRGYGAEIVLYVRSEEDRAVIAQQICDERGATLVPPYDDALIIAGQGTAALELLREVPDLDIILVPTGGAGLLSGTSVVAQGMNPNIDVYGVEPENGNDVQQSLAAGMRVTIPVPDTIADGMMTQSPGDITFSLVQRYARGVVTVTDEEIREAMRFAFQRLKLVIEPSGASSLAALMFDKVQHAGKRVGLIISGGNVDSATFAHIIATD
ncbi:MAG: pyridoxal-phosphate dependent enzyme [Vulcanimicrobiaceae bacterium]